MKLLVYDTECNSLDTNLGFIQEIAWGVFDSKTKRLLKAQSKLVRWSIPYDMTEEAKAVTGLTKEFCDQNGEDAVKVFADFESDLAHCEYLVAHNGRAYDKPMLLSNLKKSLSTIEATWDYKSYTSSKLLIDTFTDIDYPKHIKMQSLKYLAYDHGYILTGAHEALNDVLACAHLLFSYDLEQTIKNASQPIFRIEIKIPYGDLNTTHVKENGFKWDGDRKIWHRNMRADKIESFKLPYPETAKMEKLLL